MAQQDETRSRRGLFGLGGKSPRPAGGPAPQRPPAYGPASAQGEADIAALNMRALAGAAAHAAAGGALPDPVPALGVVGLASRAAHYADARSPWFAYWCEQLHCALRPHRKLWEFAIVLQALYESGVMAPGAKVLGFGVGGEPLPSYLAGLGLQVVATDLPGAAEGGRVFRHDFVAPDAFETRVEVSDLDMRRLDDQTLRGFDACWSCGVANEMANMDEAFDTLIGAMDVLRPGGVAVHTLDFAFADDLGRAARGDLTFPRRFLERLQDALDGRGHSVAPLSFDLGAHPLDGYVDQEPFEVDGAEAWRALWAENLGAPHLKLKMGEALKTSFAVIVRARG
jgi:hypothetical protein